MNVLLCLPVLFLAGCSCGNPHLNASMSTIGIRNAIVDLYHAGMEPSAVAHVNEMLGLGNQSEQIFLWSGTCIGQFAWTPSARIEFVYVDGLLHHVIHNPQLSDSEWMERIVELNEEDAR